MTTINQADLSDRGPVFIVGAGPSGLTTAYRLRRVRRMAQRDDVRFF
jgi:cation diffusion facilitator CzcD-associated flavoprotein CzcO